MFNIEHFILFTILFCISFAMTMKSQKSYEKKFWRTTALFIIAYTVIVGLRYGWGQDYVRYEYSFNTLEYDYSKDYDVAYWNFYKIVKELGMPFSCSVLISTMLIIFSYFYMVNAMNGSKYMLMLFLPATLLVTTYAMRQFQAIAYINIAIGLLFRNSLSKNKIASIIISMLLILLAYHTHAGSIIYAIPFAIFLIFRNIKPFSYKITICAYLCTIIFSGFVISFSNNLFLNIFQDLIVTDHLQGYIETIDTRVLGSESMNEETFGHSGVFIIFHYIAYIALIYVTGKSLKIAPNINVTIIYNITITATLLQQVFYSQEIMRRIIDPLFILYFIPLGYAIDVFIQYKNNRFKEYLFYGVCILIVLLRIYYPMYPFLTSFNLAGFVWD